MPKHNSPGSDPRGMIHRRVKILENLNSNSLAKAKILWSVGQWPREARMVKEKELKNVLGLSLYVLVT